MTWRLVNTLLHTYQNRKVLAVFPKIKENCEEFVNFLEYSDILFCMKKIVGICRHCLLDNDGFNRSGNFIGFPL